jgi:hypothetical protein
MVNREWVISMPLQNLLKLLHCVVVVEVVEVIECGLIQRIVRAIRQSFGVIDYLLGERNQGRERQKETKAQGAQGKPDRQCLVASSDVPLSVTQYSPWKQGTMKVTGNKGLVLGQSLYNSKRCIFAWLSVILARHYRWIACKAVQKHSGSIVYTRMYLVLGLRYVVTR